MPYPQKIDAEAVQQAALELLEQGGEEALSMRALAERLGVKAPSLYRHYPDKDALLVAMLTRANAELHRQMEASAARRRSPRAALTAVAEAYLAFARARPRLYGLLMQDRLLARADPAAGKALWNAVLARVGALSRDPDDTAGAVALWAFLHGFVGLERSGMFGASGPKGGFERGLGALLDGLEKG